MRPGPLNREFARLLERAGWTQAEAARQLSLTPAAISRYLSGETRPSVTVIRLFKLLLGDATPTPDPAAARPERAAAGEVLLPLEPWERGLLLELRRLSPEAREAVVEGLRAMLEAARGGRARTR